MGPSCELKLASPVLHNCEKLCVALFWDTTQYSLVETLCFFVTLVATYQRTWSHSPLDNDMNAHSCKDLKLCITDQQLNTLLKNSYYQKPQPYTTTSSPPQLLTHWQPQPQQRTPHRQQLSGFIIIITMWCSDCYRIIFLQKVKYSRFYVSVFITYLILVRFSLVGFN